MTNFNLDDFLPYKLAVAAQKVSGAFFEIYGARFGLDIAEWRVIAHLNHESSVSVREITNRVGLEKSRVSRAAGRLVARGYVMKVGDGTDRRLVQLSLTTSGRALMAEISPLAAAFEADIMADLGPLGPEMRRALDRLIEKTGDPPGA